MTNLSTLLPDYVATGGGGGGMTFTYVNVNTTLTADTGIYSEAGLTHTLPATPSTGAKCSVYDVSDNAGSNAITVERNGETIMGAAEDFILNMNGGRVDFLYTGTTWVYSYVLQTIQPSQTITRTKRQFFDAHHMTKGVTTTGPTLQAAGANNLEAYTYFSFPTAVWSVCDIKFTMPLDWDGGNVRFRLFWRPSSTNTGDVFGYIRAGAGGDGQDTSASYWGASSQFLDTALGTAYSRQVTPWTSYTTVGANPGPDALFDIDIIRSGSSAEDTFTGTMRLIGLEIEYTTEETLTATINNNPNILYNEQTGTTYTIQASDAGKEIVFTNVAAVAVTLPDGLQQNFQCVLSQEGAGTVTVTPSGSDTLNGAGTGIATSAQYTALHLGKRTATNWLVKGA